VWPESTETTVVLEWPNWLGALEAAPNGPSVCITEPGTRPKWSPEVMVVSDSGSHEVVTGNWRPTPTDEKRFGMRQKLNAWLVAHLSSVRGITPAWTVTSPVAVLLLDRPVEAMLDACPPPVGLAADPLLGFAEFPGGLRLEVRTSVDRTDLRSWSAEFTRAFTSEERAP